MQLSILIPTTEENKKNLDILIAILGPQMEGLQGDIEILIEGDRDKGIGAKLNGLIKDAMGKYVWMLKDTDIVSETCVIDIFSCIALDPDVITISGMTTWNDRDPCDWKQGINEDRKPNYCSPMKRRLASIIPFRKRKIDALEMWAKQMKVIAPWVNEVEIEKPIIHNRNELRCNTQTSN